MSRSSWSGHTEELTDFCRQSTNDCYVCKSGDSYDVFITGNEDEHQYLNNYQPEVLVSLMTESDRVQTLAIAGAEGPQVFR